MPRLRRLRDPGHGPAVPARAGAAAGADRLGGGHRLRGPLRLLHGHLRGARNPRPRPGARDRPGARPSRPLDLGRHRRRRRAVDRRQPPDPRAAAERADQDPPVQQPDLRPHQGPVLAHQRGGEGHQVDPVRLPGPPLQPDRARARRRGDLRRAHRRHGPRAPGRGAARRHRAPGLGLHRDLPELQRVQRRCLRRGAREGQGGRTRSGSSTASRSASAPRASAAWSAPPTAAWGSRRSRRWAPRRCSSTTPTTRTRASPSRSPTSASGRTARPRSGSSAPSSDPVYGEGTTRELEAAREGVGTDELDSLFRSGDTWTVE